MRGNIITKNQANLCRKASGASWAIMAVGSLTALMCCLYSFSVKANDDGGVAIQGPVDVPLPPVMPSDLSPVIPMPPNEILPNGVVAEGAARIQCFEQGDRLITQTTDRAVIDWSGKVGFDVPAGTTTQFQVPSSHSLSLNRVHSDRMTEIHGNLFSNGNVIIINQHGVVFGAGAVVDVNGLLATTADIDNKAFMRATNKFDFNVPGNNHAAIINRGHITVKEAGLCGFVAPHLINSGIITARLGSIALSAGDTVTLDLYGDRLMEVGVSEAVKSQLLINTGRLDASAGTILMTTAAAQKVVNSLIINTGALKAQSVGSKNGEIVIQALGRNAVKDNVAEMKGLKEGRSVVYSNGTADVSGINQGERGGKVRVMGDDIRLLDGTILNASGNEGVSGTTDGKEVSAEREGSAGGDIQIGGDYKGGGTTPTAETLYVAPRARIYNDALRTGDAGRTIFWADEKTTYLGKVFARALGIKGNGGFVETSGAQDLIARGYVDLGAKNGMLGTWLLDPTDVVISTSDPYNGYTADGVNYIIPNQLNGVANINIAATNDITLDFQVSTISFYTAEQSFSLNADNQIIIPSAGGIQTLGGAVSFTAANGIFINQHTPAGSGFTIDTTGSGSFSAGANVTFTGALRVGDPLTVTSGTAGTTTFTSTIEGPSSLAVTGTGIAFNGNIGVSTPLSSLTLNGSVTLNGNINAFATTLAGAPTFDSTAGSISFSNTSLANGLVLNNSGGAPAYFYGTFSLGSNLTLNNVTLPDAIILANDVTISTTGITFGAINGAYNLVLNGVNYDVSGTSTQALVTLNANIGGITPLQSLTFDNVRMGAGNAGATAITATGAVTFRNNSILSDAWSNNIDISITGGSVVLPTTTVNSLFVQSTTGDITLPAGKTITIANTVASDLENLSTTTPLILVAEGNFINNAGAGVLSVQNGGRWLVYYNADAPSNVFGGLEGVCATASPFSYPALPGGDNGGNYLLYVVQSSAASPSAATTAPTAIAALRAPQPFVLGNELKASSTVNTAPVHLVVQPSTAPTAQLSPKVIPEKAGEDKAGEEASGMEAEDEERQGIRPPKVLKFKLKR